MGFFFVEPDIYRKYRAQVVEMSQSVQINIHEHLPADKRQPGFSDAQIAEKLGLDERTIVEIRCVAERDQYGVDEFEKALEFKDRSCRGYAEQGLAFSTKKYLKRKR
ncbi:MAG: hypothetical protein JKY32_13905 [Rhizobiales bacterium]|nr:hypothetical protein [Hyphomicrobiales bacterium]